LTPGALVILAAIALRLLIPNTLALIVPPPVLPE
jgi:hypothetical protein